MSTKKTHQYSLSVFLPFYNEEANIRDSVEQTLFQLAGMREITDYEVIIVDDGSRDGTKKIAEALVRENTHVRLVAHESNRGYGEALRSGIRASRFEYVFFTDGDLQFDIGELPRLTRYIPRYQAVIGYRAPRRDPFLRILNAWGWNKLNRLAFGLKVRDIDCAFKLFKRDIVANLPVISGGAMLSAEILIRLQQQGIALKEVPVAHLPRLSGSPTGAKPGVILRALKEFWQLYQNTTLGLASYLQASRFIQVGIINTLVDIAVYYFLTRYTGYFPSHITQTRILSFLSGSISSFILNRYWTFERRGPVSAAELVKFYATILASLELGVLSMQALIDLLHVYDLVALFLSIIITFIWNFTISRLWVFKKSPHSYQKQTA